jgi:hypothetical protein
VQAFQCLFAMVFDKSFPVLADSDNPVDARHRQFKESAWVWGSHVKTELLLDLAT